jgi:hypothetical protein
MDRITLRNDQQTTIAIGFARKGKTVAEVGDSILVASSAATILNATFNPATGMVDIIPIDDAVGSSDVSVIATLADGVVLPPQVIGFDVVHADADAVVLTAGAVVDKTVSIVVPVPNEPAVVIVAPDAPVADVKPADPVKASDSSAA